MQDQWDNQTVDLQVNCNAGRNDMNTDERIEERGGDVERLER
jgi:hypothetical protein